MSRKIRYVASRRRFLKQAGITALASLSAGRSGFAAVESKERRANTSSVIKNRAPLAENAFYMLPVGAIRPSGWLLDQMKIQANGLSGHLDETWPDVGNNSGWLGGTGESWERGPYYLDGLVPLAYLLDDDRLKAKAQRFIEWTLTHQSSDGMIGPPSNNDWWPRMVMVKALAQYEEATGDPRVIPALSRYFAYQLRSLPTRPLTSWGKFRWQDNALVVLWLYNRTGDPDLIKLARLLHQQGYDWQAQFANFPYKERITPQAIALEEGKELSEIGMATHGVNNGQAIKVSPVWSLVSEDATDRRAIHQQLAALDTYHGLPNGMFSCDEHLAGRNPSQGSELCTVVETMYSLEQSLAILGEPGLGDRLEQIAFNALPGTFTEDMWAHQYNQEPNQVECSLHSKPWTTDGPESNLYGLEPNFGCCTANFHQGWPKFTASLWMASPDDGLVAAAYAPCQVDTIVRDVPVRLQQQTEYPFRGTVRITLQPEKPVRFPLSLRIPAWADGTSLRVNGAAQAAPQQGSFAKLEQTWKPGDVIEVEFRMTPRVVKGYRNSISIERGPLVFSYPIGESWVKLRDRGMTADWQVFPSTQWNYAVHADPAGIATRELRVGSSPFALKGAPVQLQVRARKLVGWRALDGVAAEIPESPVRSSEASEQITLVPYAAAKLRITAFPQLDTSPG